MTGLSASRDADKTDAGPPSGGTFDLERFIQAQDRGASYRRALEEITAGHKDSHWIWWIFPQLAGLGRSATSQAYALTSLDEARAYLEHPVLGDRLREITRVVCAHAPRPLASIFGADDVKFRSSMTLFLRAAPGETLFADALQLFQVTPDELTDRLLEVRS